MMDALISHFADQMRRRKDGTDVVDNAADDGESLLPFILVLLHNIFVALSFWL